MEERLRKKKSLISEKEGSEGTMIIINDIN